MSFAVGSLVRARGREWVVLPASDGDMLVLRPLGGGEDEIAGVYRPLETVEPARFALPDPETPGDYRSCRLLRDAVRLGFRSSAGPFRSFGSIAVEPRPYQLVPLLLALKLPVARLLIADDVGIGKTVEAALIARELMDRGEVTRLAVLCPPHLAEQWQAELRDKFHLDAELVLPSTVTRLERECGPGQSVFDGYPIVIVSTDFIKSDRRRDDFLRHCPELVIVDEAHTCVSAGEGRGGRHQRHQLVSRLAADRERHVILVTATPHSGKEEAFRSLLALLDPAFAALPDDLSGARNAHLRERLAAHVVQRRRANIELYADAATAFPTREERDATYELSPAYRALFDEVLEYARTRVGDPTQDIGDHQGNRGNGRQRLRWWSILALLRALASSPAAAAATLDNRSAASVEGATQDMGDGTDGTDDTAELDIEAAESLPFTLLDPVDEGAAEGLDVVPNTAVAAGGEGRAAAEHRKLLREMAARAAALQGPQHDAKLRRALKLVAALVKDGYRPVVFCRFIPTAAYVARELRAALPRDVETVAVTSEAAAEAREQQVLALTRAPKRVLVCTDCLSEGLNLQHHFDAVVHYDLSWNPTRHEQREGRVDRFGQPRPRVRITTLFGQDNPIDGIVLDVLLRKSRTIRTSLGISVPLPVDSAQVVQAVFEGLRLRERRGGARQLELFPELNTRHAIDELHGAWDVAARREAASQAVFAQRAIKPDEVAAELAAMREAIGAGVDVAGFTAGALETLRAVVERDPSGRIRVDLAETPAALREALDLPSVTFAARFEQPVGDGELYLQRTHPLVEALASYVMDTALDPLSGAVARRSGVISTRAVARRTTLLLVRFRYHIILQRGGTERPLLAEDAALLAFAGPPHNAQWLDARAAEALLDARPDADLHEERKREFLRKVVEGYDHLRPHLEDVARERGEQLLAAHRRVRDAANARGRYAIEPQLPPDILGLYVYLPAPA